MDDPCAAKLVLDSDSSEGQTHGKFDLPLSTFRESCSINSLRKRAHSTSHVYPIKAVPDPLPRFDQLHARSRGGEVVVEERGEKRFRAAEVGEIVEEGEGIERVGWVEAWVAERGRGRVRREVLDPECLFGESISERFELVRWNYSHCRAPPNLQVSHSPTE